jgi:hypothetical protein
MLESYQRLPLAYKAPNDLTLQEIAELQKWCRIQHSNLLFAQQSSQLIRQYIKETIEQSDSIVGNIGYPKV